MFTGLIERVGRLKARGGGKLSVGIDAPFDDPLSIGESVAVNGVCLTLERFDDRILEFHTLDETLSRTNLAELPLGTGVNLERAMRADGRFGGHFVTGHVDEPAEVLEWRLEGNDRELRVALPDSGRHLLFEKGSVAIDGVSLTVASVDSASFAVRLIPETLSATALEERAEGERVNLEFDMIAKCVNTRLDAGMEAAKGGGLTFDRLRGAGWEDV
jgi:riboflavin synthase